MRGIGPAGITVPREHPRNYIDILPLPSGILTLQAVNIECQNHRDSQACQGMSDFMHEDNA